MEQTLLLAPLAGAVIAALGWRLIGESAARWTATALILLAAGLGWLLALNASPNATVRYFQTWIESGSLSSAFAFRLDLVMAVPLALVISLSAIAHVIALTRPATPDAAAGAGKPLPGQEARLCAGMGLLTFAMLLLIVADDLAQFLAGWIAVGFASYVLTGLFLRRPAACKAALRVALTLRCGELVLISVIVFLFALADTIRFDDVFEALPDLEQMRFQILGLQVQATELIVAGIGLASLIMAAQVVFFGWIMDAAEAPLPGAVLLLTAGPIVAASVLLMRMTPGLDLTSVANGWRVAAAMATTLIASTSATVQTDPVRAIACLAGAQAGFVLAAFGVGAPEAAMWYLVSAMTALAALALAIGAVGRGTEPRDLARLGAMGRKTPLLLAAAVFACASLGALGVPGSGFGFTGFLSASAVFAALANAPSPEWLWAGGLAFTLCSLAAWRLVLRVFVAAPRSSEATAELSPVSGIVTVLVLAFAVASATMGLFLITPEPVQSDILVVLAGLVGLGLAAIAARAGAGLSRRLKNAAPWVPAALVNGWYMSSILRKAVALPLIWIADSLARTPRDEEGQGPQPGMLRLAPVLAQQASRLQGGLLASYGVALAIGVVVLVLWIVLMGRAS